jgi:hypothetical protein
MVVFQRVQGEGTASAEGLGRWASLCLVSAHPSEFAQDNNRRQMRCVQLHGRDVAKQSPRDPWRTPGTSPDVHRRPSLLPPRRAARCAWRTWRAPAPHHGGLPLELVHQGVAPEAVQHLVRRGGGGGRRVSG